MKQCKEVDDGQGMIAVDLCTTKGVTFLASRNEERPSGLASAYRPKRKF